VTSSGRRPIVVAAPIGSRLPDFTLLEREGLSHYLISTNLLHMHTNRRQYFISYICKYSVTTREWNGIEQ
jgi:hypothetical protein